MCVYLYIYIYRGLSIYFFLSGKLKKYENGAWYVVPHEDRIKMTKLDGQMWIALYNLLLSTESQRKYNFDNFNKSQLLKVKGVKSMQTGYVFCSLILRYIVRTRFRN